MSQTQLLHVTFIYKTTPLKLLSRENLTTVGISGQVRGGCALMRVNTFYLSNKEGGRYEQ